MYKLQLNSRHNDEGGESCLQEEGLGGLIVPLALSLTNGKHLSKGVIIPLLGLVVLT